jgi:hypothetical protein
LALKQIDVVGGMSMIEDGPGDTESVAFIMETTTITNNRVAQLFLGLGGNSAALATHLYSKFEAQINDYFDKQHVVSSPADVENEALRFAIWMYMARGLDSEDGGEGANNEKQRQEAPKIEESENKEPKGEVANNDSENSGDESEGLYDA